jgi:hypothetical protein
VGDTCIYLGETNYGEVGVVEAITAIDANGASTPCFKLRLTSTYAAGGRAYSMRDGLEATVAGRAAAAESESDSEFVEFARTINESDLSFRSSPSLERTCSWVHPRPTTAGRATPAAPRYYVVP